MISYPSEQNENVKFNILLVLVSGNQSIFIIPMQL
jgi:hypothetical protein